MTAPDHPKLPRATLRDDQLYIEGEKEPYFRDPERTILLLVDSVTICGGYHQDRNRGAKADIKGDWVFTKSLSGHAKLEGVNRFAVIGRKTDSKTPISFGLQPLHIKTAYHWHVEIYFLSRETKLEEQFHVSGYCPKKYFDDLLAAIRRGHVDHLTVAMETTMWQRQSLGTLYLAPSIRRESTNPDFETGQISMLAWQEKFASKRRARKQPQSK